MNMLAGRKVSITDDTPGTTRDRVSTLVTLMGESEDSKPIQVELTDTGGFGAYTRHDSRFDDAGVDLSALTKDIESQISKAVANADLVLFVVDTQTGITPMDETVARLLREGGLGPATDTPGQSAAGKVILCANKADGPKWENFAYEAAALGFGEPLIVSAKNNYRRRDMVERLHAAARDFIRQAKKDRDPRVTTEGPAGMPEMKLAIVGKRNSGKSTLVNTLAGEDRVIVSEIAGTTRDAIDVRFTMEGRSFLAIDTAGLRRKKSFDQRIEWWALDRMEQAIDRCDVALVMVDATEPLSHVDHTVGMMLAERYKPCVIVVNKWDLALGQAAKGQRGGAGKKVTPEMYEDYIRKELKGLWYAPISFISAKNNRNVKETIELAFELMQQSGARVGTGVLNRLIRGIVERQGPPSRNGAFAKVYYTAQIGTQPPTVALVVNKPDMFTPQYERFLLNRLRDESPFGEVPIKLVIKGRSQRPTKEDAETIENLIEQAAATGTIDGMETEGDSPRQEANRSKARARAVADASAYFDEPSAKAEITAKLMDEALAPFAHPQRPKAPPRTAPKPASKKTGGKTPGKTRLAYAAKIKPLSKSSEDKAAPAKPARVKTPQKPMSRFGNKPGKAPRAIAVTGKARPKAAEAKARSRKRTRGLRAN